MAGRFDDDETAPAAPPRGNRFDDTPLTRGEQVAKEQSSMGWPAYLGQAAHDFVYGAGDIFSFGMGKRADAALDVLRGKHPDYSTALAARVKEAEDIRERSPVATTVGNVGGGIATGGAVGAGGVGANLAARGGAGPLARFLGFGAEGAALGGAQGAGQTYSGDPADYASNAGKGAAIGGVISGTVGATLVPKNAVQVRAGDPRTGQPIVQPTNDELKALSDRGYQVLSRMRVTYPEGYKHATLDGARAQLQAANIPPEMARSIYTILDRARATGGPISPAQVDAIRQQLNGFVNNPNAVGAEKAGIAANILRNALDDMIQNGARHSSNPAIGARAAQVVGEARGNAAARFRSMQLTDVLTNAETAAAAGGKNVGERLVSKGNKILETKRGEQPNTRGWIDEERNRLTAAITPTARERVANAFAGLPLEKAGGLAGAAFGGGAGTTAGVAGGPAGMVTGGLTGATAGGAAGYGLGAATKAGLQGFSSNAIRQRWEDAAAAMRGRSPAYQARLQGAVPVAGPGMGIPSQGLAGAATGELGTPYTDERDALAWSAMRGLMQ